MSRVALRLCRSAITAALLLGATVCHPGRHLPHPALEPTIHGFINLESAILWFIGELPDSELASLRACQQVLVHPLVGSEWYTEANDKNRPWRTVGRLPVEQGDTLRYGSRLLTISPFLTASSPVGCQAIAAHLRPGRSPDETLLFLELFVPDGDRWRLAVRVLADAHRHDTGWWLRVLAVNW